MPANSPMSPHSLEAILCKKHDLLIDELYLAASFFSPNHEKDVLGLIRLDQYLESHQGASNAAQPPAGFDLDYYLDRYPDLGGLRIHPFLHYIKHGIHELRFSSGNFRISRQNTLPSVTVILPAYNHATYIKRRLDSIAQQTHVVDEIIILDDCSTDGTDKLINDYLRENSLPAKVIRNELNSGSVFSQWRRGYHAAKSDIVWICESDDLCDLNFLETSLPYFQDQNVNLVCCDIQMIDEEDRQIEFLNEYRRGASPSLDWSQPLEMFAHEWFSSGFQIKNLIPNSGGALLKRRHISDDIWTRLCEFTACADWIFYSMVAGCGKIIYHPYSKAYFRQHHHNTSKSLGKTTSFIAEHAKVWAYLSDKSSITYRHDKMRFALHVGSNLGFMAKKHDDDEITHKFGKLFNYELPTHSHPLMTIGIAIQAIDVGGGEIFPISLASYLHREGLAKVVLIVASNSVSVDVLQKIPLGLPILFLSNYSPSEFKTVCKRMGIHLLNTHSAHCDYTLLNGEFLDLPVVASLHGSYDTCDLQQWHLDNLAKSVSVFTYLTSKNKNFVYGTDLAYARFIKVQNAILPDDALCDKASNALKSLEGKIVFAFAARGIPEKGWEQLISAFLEAKTSWAVDVNIGLLLCGDSQYVASLKSLNDRNDIVFAGSVSNVYGVFRRCHCAVLPTRFKGESMPLVLLEALAAGIPSIATAVGDIPSFVSPFDTKCQIGWVLDDGNQNEKEFIASLSYAMRVAVQDDDGLSVIRDNISRRQHDYSMGSVAETYLCIYRNAASSYVRKTIPPLVTDTGSNGNNLDQRDSHDAIQVIKRIFINSLDKSILSSEAIAHCYRKINAFQILDLPHTVVSWFELANQCRLSGITTEEILQNLCGLEKAEVWRPGSLGYASLLLRKTRLLQGNALSTSAPSHVLVLPSANLILYDIPKNASTVIRLLVLKFLRNLSGESLGKGDCLEDPDNLHGTYVAAVEKYNQLDLNLVDATMFKRFALLRDPAKRLVSAFYNKYIHLVDPRTKWFRSYLSKNKLTLDQIGFEEFVYILSVEGFPDDPHLQPQSCFLPSPQYIDVLKGMNNADGFIDEFAAHLGIEWRDLSLPRLNRTLHIPSFVGDEGLASNLPIVHLQKVTVFPSVRQTLSSSLRQKIRLLYADDYELFDRLSDF